MDNNHAHSSPSASPGTMRDRICDAALTLFAQRGFDATSIGEVAKVAGASKANVVYHFGNKATLWKEAIERHWAEVDAFYVARFEADIPVTREGLKTILLLYLEACCRYPAYVQIMNLEGHTKSWRNEWLATRHLRRHTEFLATYIQKLIAEGLSRSKDPLVFQTLLTGGAQLLIGQFQLWIEATGQDPREPEFREKYAEAVTRYLTN